MTRFDPAAIEPRRPASFGRTAACLLLAGLAAALLTAAAEPPREPPAADAEESLTGWQWFQEVQLDDPAGAPLFVITLPPSVFERAQVLPAPTDPTARPMPEGRLGDLRLFDNR